MNKRRRERGEENSLAPLYFFSSSSGGAAFTGFSECRRDGVKLFISASTLREKVAGKKKEKGAESKEFWERDAGGGNLF